jgi:hypothetical protein
LPEKFSLDDLRRRLEHLSIAKTPQAVAVGAFEIGLSVYLKRKFCRAIPHCRRPAAPWYQLVVFCKNANRNDRLTVNGAITVGRPRLSASPNLMWARPRVGCRLSSGSFAGPISKFFCRLQRDERLIAATHSVLTKPCRVQAQAASTPIGSLDLAQLSTFVIAEGTTQAPRPLLRVTCQPCRQPKFDLLLH